MSSIKSLQKIAESNPIGFLSDELFLNEYKIFEKIDAHSIQLEKIGTSIVIKKRNATQFLTKIDRILDKRWKPLMLWILSNKDKLSENLLYNIDYLPYNKVNQIFYNNLPKNFICLNSIEIKNKKNKESYSLADIALNLDISYQSELIIENKEIVTDLLLQLSTIKLNNIDNGLYIELFNSLKEHLMINYDIEGFIIKSKNFTCKIMDPNWKEIPKAEPNIQYQLITSLMMEFIIDKLDNNFNIELKEKHQDRRYIEFIDNIFIEWIKNESNLINIDLPDFIGMETLNLKEISNKIKNKISNNYILKSHYSIMLNAFRKNKNKNWGIFNEEKRNRWNLLLFNKINKYIEKKNT